jgi:hypothetical protein
LHTDPLCDIRSLEKVLEPILDRHREKLRQDLLSEFAIREKLRQDLLSEFAILERYEERMRLETMRRIEAMTERAMGSISHSLALRSGSDKSPQVPERGTVFRAAAIVAALCVGLALGSVTGESGSDVELSHSGAEPVAMLVD